jgi:hypothetical protein
MIKAKYKVLDTANNVHIIVDSFEAACAMKGVDPKKASKPKRRVNRKLANDYVYPYLYTIAVKAKFTKPLDDLASSKRLTQEYVKHFLTTNHLVP